MRLGMAALLLIASTSLACDRHAVAYLNVSDPSTKGSISMKAYSGKSGLYLGETPLYVPLVKGSSDPNPTLSVIVVGDCYPTLWQFVEVSNWAPTRAGAMDAAYRNDVLFIARRFSDCASRGGGPPSSSDAPPGISSGRGLEMK